MDPNHYKDPQYFRHLLNQMVVDLEEFAATTERPNRTKVEDTDPALLDDALQQFLDIVARVEADQERRGGPSADSAGDITELGEYGFALLRQLADWMEYRHWEDASPQLAQLYLGFALWVARQGGNLLTLEPVVDACALSANRTQVPEALLTLYHLMGEILAAVTPSIREDLEKGNPGRPWRLLNLNRAIVATRSLDPDAMRTAFDQILKHFPEDAPSFFAQGMEQMDALNYPPHVRTVMQDYYNDWHRKHSLH